MTSQEMTIQRATGDPSRTDKPTRTGTTGKTSETSNPTRGLGAFRRHRLNTRKREFVDLENSNASKPTSRRFQLRSWRKLTALVLGSTLLIVTLLGTVMISHPIRRRLPIDPSVIEKLNEAHAGKVYATLQPRVEKPSSPEEIQELAMRVVNGNINGFILDEAEDIILSVGAQNHRFRLSGPDCLAECADEEEVPEEFKGIERRPMAMMMRTENNGDSTTAMLIAEVPVWKTKCVKHGHHINVIDSKTNEPFVLHVVMSPDFENGIRGACAMKYFQEHMKELMLAGLPEEARLMLSSEKSEIDPVQMAQEYEKNMAAFFKALNAAVKM